MSTLEVSNLNDGTTTVGTTLLPMVLQRFWNNTNNTLQLRKF